MARGATLFRHCTNSVATQFWTFNVSNTSSDTQPSDRSPKRLPGPIQFRFAMPDFQRIVPALLGWRRTNLLIPFNAFGLLSASVRLGGCESQTHFTFPSHIIPSMTSSNICIIRNAECITSDGTILRADVYYQSDSEPQPVLVCRTPYNKLLPRYQEHAMEIANGGYTAVVQDMRGRYASDGEYFWMWRDKHETADIQDGYDTIEWAANLPQSDGRVGTWGHSNASWATWMTLHSNPPSLTAALASGISMNMLDITFGVWETGRRLEWTYMMAADVRRREERTDGPLTPEEATFRWNAVERSKYIWWLPLAEIPEHVFAGLTEQYQTFLRNTRQDFMRFDEAHPRVEVPMMQITGWWDRLIGTIDNYEGLITDGDQDLRTQHRLIVGPWGHDATNYSRNVGPIDYGPEAETTYADLIIRWYDYAMKGIDNGTDDEKPVQLFILNRNEWIGADAWPLPETEYTDLYLSSSGAANTANGDRVLAFEPKPGAASDEFDYDPRDPVMSLMHQNSQSIPIDQAPNDHRQDILVYETEPMTADLDVIGPVHLKLWAATDAPETDFAVKAGYRSRRWVVRELDLWHRADAVPRRL